MLISDAHETATYRSFRTANKQMFSDRLTGTNGTNLQLMDSVEELYQRFNETLTELFNECFSLCYKHRRVIDTK